MVPKTMGILGGMGPFATSLFFQKVVELTPAKTDQEHIPIVVYNNPQIPDRTDSILHQGKNPVGALKASLALLQKLAPDFICIPCNTVHFYYDEIQESIDIPIIHLIESVVDFAINECPEIGAVGLLATTGTIKSGLYHGCFRQKEIGIIHPDEGQFDTLQNAIHALKHHTQTTDTRQIQGLANSLVEAGAEGVILGCTELSLIKQKLSLNVPIFDSVEILAQRAVNIAVGKERL